jgi:pyruvate dehydrogenase E1 component alpha subunit
MNTTTGVLSDLAIERDHALYLLSEMVRIRRFEERCAELYSAAKIRGFLHLYIGEEAIAVGVIQSLRATDPIVATYREHGQAIARGITMDSIMAEMFGKVEGCSRGRGGSMHIFDASTHFYGGNAIVGGGLPLAVGLALAISMQGRSEIVACFFGEGATAEGEFHEAMNLAALWKLPVLFCCENNLYAMGTAIWRSHSVTDVTQKAAAYDIPAEAVDGMDVVAVEAATNAAVDAVRSTGSPYLLEFRTYRFRAHSMYDPDLYRPKSEIAEWKLRDPIETFQERLLRQGLLSEEEVQQIDARAVSEVEAAVRYAEEGLWEDIEDLTRFVHSESTTS